MGKADMQYKLIKTLAFSPWIYTDNMLASELGVSQCTIKPLYAIPLTIKKLGCELKKH